MERASCHCNAVTLELSEAPTEVTECNCSLCRRYGVLWAYYPAERVQVTSGSDQPQSYCWNGQHVDFHRCRHCGCVTHWTKRDAGAKTRGVNARLFAPEVLAAARLRHKDGADTGKYLD